MFSDRSYSLAFKAAMVAYAAFLAWVLALVVATLIAWPHAPDHRWLLLAVPIFVGIVTLWNSP